MGNKNDGVALILQVLELDEELRCFLRGQHGRRFVHDQDLRPADQRLQDLHLLLHANRNIHYFRFRFNMKIEFFGVFFGDLDRFGFIDERAGFCRDHPENHVFRYGKARHQHEVLVDHPDPVGNGDRRRTEVQRFSVDDDLTAGGLFQPEEHLHQGAFACPVFTHQRVDLTSAEVEIDALVCRNAVGINFCDFLHLDDELVLRTGYSIWHDQIPPVYTNMRRFRRASS